MQVNEKGACGSVPALSLRQRSSTQNLLFMNKQIKNKNCGNAPELKNLLLTIVLHLICI